MKVKMLNLLKFSQTSIILVLLLLTISNEVFDLPHLIFHDTATSYSQRIGEIIIELSIFAIVMTIQILLFRKMYRDIRVLEGFIPICASCKKIRTQEDQWQQMETYISDHSLATFSHGLCPDCYKKLYPDLAEDK